MPRLTKKQHLHLAHYHLRCVMGDDATELFRPCESCDRPTKLQDSEGVPLCYKCAQEMFIPVDAS